MVAIFHPTSVPAHAEQRTAPIDGITFDVPSAAGTIEQVFVPLADIDAVTRRSWSDALRLDNSPSGPPDMDPRVVALMVNADMVRTTPAGTPYAGYVGHGHGSLETFVRCLYPARSA